MMKRKFLAVILPIIGCATVVGSGFGAWYFGETVNASKTGDFFVNIGITDEVDDATSSLSIGGNIEEFDKYTLLLDQGGHSNKGILDSGIMLTNSDPLPVKVEATTGVDWEFTVTYDGGTTTIKDLYDAGLQIRFEIKINLGADLSYYVGVKSDAKVTLKSEEISLATTNLNSFTTKNNGVSYSTEYVVDGEDLQATNVTYDFALDMDTAAKTYSNALFEYKLKPQNSTQYTAMCDALTGETITFVVIAHIENAGAHLVDAGA